MTDLDEGDGGRETTFEQRLRLIVRLDKVPRNAVKLRVTGSVPETALVGDGKAGPDGRESVDRFNRLGWIVDPRGQQGRALSGRLRPPVGTTAVG